jgi:hypothetical protein
MFDETEELLEKRKEYFENLNCKEKNLIEKERFKKMCEYDNLENLNPDYKPAIIEIQWILQDHSMITRIKLELEFKNFINYLKEKI